MGIRTGGSRGGRSLGNSGGRGGSSGGRGGSSGGRGGRGGSSGARGGSSGGGSAASKPSTADNLLSGGPERPYVNPDLPPNKPVPPTPSQKPKPNDGKKPGDTKKPDGKNNKNNKDRPDLDVDTALQAVETGLYASEVLAQDDEFNEEAGSGNNNNNGNPTQQESTANQRPKENEDPVTKPLEEKVEQNGLQNAAQNQIAAETGDSGIDNDQYLQALQLVNRYEQYGCSQKPKDNPITQKPKKMGYQF